MRGVTVRDLLTGEVLEVLDRVLSRNIEPKDVILARPLADGTGALRLRVPPHGVPRLRRSSLLGLLREGAEAREVAAAMAPQPPPTLQTTEGQDYVESTAVYDVPDVEAAWARLAARLDEHDDGSLVLGRRTSDGGLLMRGTVRRHGDRLVLQTSAVERLRELQARLLEAAPEARLVSESTRPLADLMAERGGMPGPRTDSAVDLSSPEVQAVLATMVRRHEDEWLDTEIPALGGLTPRQAAADPVARAELEALLDDLEWMGRRRQGAGVIDAGRLRDLLKLNDDRKL